MIFICRPLDIVKLPVTACCDEFCLTCCRCLTGKILVAVEIIPFQRDMEYEVEGARPRGEPKKTWREIVEKDCQAHELNREDAVDHNR